MQDDQTNPAAAPDPEPPRRSRRRIATYAIAAAVIAVAAVGLFFVYVFGTTALDLLGSSATPTVVAPTAERTTVAEATQASSEPATSSPEPTVAYEFPTVTPEPIFIPTLTPVPGVPTPSPTPTIPVAQYLGTDRVTVLLMGLDTRDGGPGAQARSDTMILLTIDPVTKRAGMLSIPRDLWVSIPGHGQNKINTAHFFGGPDLARQTVEQDFGVHIQYWARIDFAGFQKMIDAIGGVTVDATRALKDDQYPTQNNGIRRVYIPTGLQHLDGEQALWFARSRHSDNDFGRSMRQRQVLLAARQRLLQPSVIPKIPELIGIAQSSVSTNVPLIQWLPLLNLARQVNTDDITSRAIEYTMTTDVNNDGTMLVPKMAAVRQVLGEVFATSPAQTPTPAPADSTATPAPTASVATPTPAAAVTTPAPSDQGIKLNVQNGTDRNLFAANWANRLAGAGYTIAQVAQAAQSYQQTTILDHTGRAGAAQGVISALGLTSAVVQSAPPAADGADLTVILGPDVQAP